MRPEVGVCVNILDMSLMYQSFLHLSTLTVSTCLRRILSWTSPLALCPDLFPRGSTRRLRNRVWAWSALQYSWRTDTRYVRYGHVRDLLRDGDRSCSHDDEGGM